MRAEARDYIIRFHADGRKSIGYRLIFIDPARISGESNPIDSSQSDPHCN
jgi:hypothetical protein